MIPFPGESIAMMFAWESTGADFNLGSDIVYRGAEPNTDATGSRPLTAGEQWRVWVPSGAPRYLEENLSGLSIGWAVEVESGTVTVTAAEGIDEAFGDPATPPTEALGTFSVTGPGTLFIPSTFTAARVRGVLGNRPMMLVLDATSGEAVVTQIKLRVWPSSGPAGGWSDILPSFNGNPLTVNPRYVGVPIEGAATNADAGAAWDDTVAAFHAATGAATTSQLRTFNTSIGASPSASRGVYVSGTSGYNAFLTIFGWLVMFNGVDWRQQGSIDTSAYTEETDWIWPPDEVPGDPDGLVQRIGEGSTAWANATLTLTTTTDEMPGSFSVNSIAGEWDDQNSGIATEYVVPFSPSGTPLVSGTVPLATAGRQILVSISHSATAADADGFPGISLVAGQQDTASVTFGAISSYATQPAYRVWDPNGATETPQPMRLMQRGDGLGMGSGRVFGAGTRQGSIRVFGSY